MSEESRVGQSGGRIDLDPSGGRDFAGTRRSGEAEAGAVAPASASRGSGRKAAPLSGLSHSETSRPMACCPRCAAPLISTFDFPGAEFYCLECGHSCGFLSPRRGTPSPELDARYEALKAEWDEHAAGRLLLHGGWLRNCERCHPGEDPHREHATPEEWAAHEEAMAWLENRAAGTR